MVAESAAPGVEAVGVPEPKGASDATLAVLAVLAEQIALVELAVPDV